MTESRFEVFNFDRGSAARLRKSRQNRRRYVHWEQGSLDLESNTEFPEQKNVCLDDVMRVFLNLSDYAILQNHRRNISESPRIHQIEIRNLESHRRL